MKSLIRRLIAAGTLLAPSLAFAVAGVTAYSLGTSSGTNLIVLATSPAPFYGVSVSSAQAGDTFKCWNSTTTSGLTYASDETMGGAQAPAAQGPQPVAVAASRGIVCGKSNAAASALVYAAP